MRNVDIDAVREFTEKAKKDKSLIEISSELAFPQGTEKINIDNAPFMGGKGRAPNPVQYCLLGMAACFLGTFATIAGELGLEIDELGAEAETNVNLSKPLGIGDEPINNGMKMQRSLLLSAALQFTA